MTELKVIVSPHFSEEELKDEVSGIVFKKGRSIEIYSIDIEANKLSGIQSLLRKNILLPYDRATLEFVNGAKIAKDEPVKEEKPVEVVKVKEEVAEPKKPATRKKTNKKESE
ncbi:hypothetical protein ABWK22_02700 [Gottfriedia acidiceleris]|uniref:hypothetical protein n=1 Tax=Gottfriedia acidiceleris TaxID=371036 RepID=UPI00339A1C21